jgi:hypothetical protein
MNEMQEPASSPGSVKMYIGQVGKVIGYILTVLLFGLILFQLARNWQNVEWATYRLDFRYLLVSMIPHAFGLALGSIGWALIVRQISQKADFWCSVRIYYITNIGKNLPGSIWYVVGRVYLHKQDGTSNTATTIAAVLELALAALAGVVVYVIGLLITPEEPVIGREYLIVLLIVGGMLLYPPVFNRLANTTIRWLAHTSKTTVDVTWLNIMGWMGLYLIITFIGGIILFLVGNAVYPMAWKSLPVIAGAWGISVAIAGLTFWMPTNFGIRDGILVVALSAVMPISAALVVAVVWRVWVVLSELLWALVAIAVQRLHQRG